MICSHETTEGRQTITLASSLLRSSSSSMLTSQNGPHPGTHLFSYLNTLFVLDESIIVL